jgi:hypothetical protein
MPVNGAAPGAAHPYSSLRLPDFWSDRPRAWFNHLEAECDLRNPPITAAATKYHLASTALPASIRSQVAQILDNPPADSYVALKAALIALFVQTPLEDAFQLLKLPELGDQLATAQYRVVEKLWNQDGAAVKKALFLRSLPQTLQDALADDDKPLAELAERADKIIKNRRATALNGEPMINSLSGASCDAELLELNAIRQKYGSAKYPASSNSAKNFKPKEKDNTGFCFAHRKYGKEAYSCRGAPCPMVGILAPRPAGKDQADR